MTTILDGLNDDEPLALAQQLIRIPSYLWKESNVAHFIADWFRARGFDSVEVQEVPLRDGSVTHLDRHAEGRRQRAEPDAVRAH
jgi:acetylornithine deacetylase/succinyl-diaminopimelate desuccinylase-like protein